jgi:glyoxylase-like metal-dependent hydrolase (beta-lactamase superfamily II)
MKLRYIKTLGIFLSLIFTELAVALELDITRVTNKVFSAIGETQPPSYENAGHNNNLSFVIGESGVAVINGGDNYLLARALHKAIRERTPQPVKWVINENGQGHAFLGNSYWREQGAVIMAHRDAVEEIRRQGERSLRQMQERNRDQAEGTEIAVPEIALGDITSLYLGDLELEIIHFGPAHSPGDVSVWIPGEQVLIAGDIAFHQRLLGIFPDTQVAGWIASFEKMAALPARVVIPGHGDPTTIGELRIWTQGYLKYLTAEIEKILEEDGDLADAYDIDQSAYGHLDTFEELAGKNAGRLFQTLEMEAF